MIHALSSGKAGRVLTSETSERWRDVFKKSEDLLTSMFWSRISYLPTEQLNLFMSQLLSTDFDCGPLLDVNFWERLSYVTNQIDRVVEPDVILEFRHHDIIVEVKPPFGKGQYQEQWRLQVESYLQSQTNKKIFFIALGNCPGNVSSWVATFKQRYPDIEFYAVSWERVSDALFNTLGKNNRIAADCIKLLNLYGIRSPCQSWASLSEIIYYPLNKNGFVDL